MCNLRRLCGTCESQVQPAMVIRDSRMMQPKCSTRCHKVRHHLRLAGATCDGDPRLADDAPKTYNSLAQCATPLRPAGSTCESHVVSHMGQCDSFFFFWSPNKGLGTQNHQPRIKNFFVLRSGIKRNESRKRKKT